MRSPSQILAGCWMQVHNSTRQASSAKRAEDCHALLSLPVQGASEPLPSSVSYVRLFQEKLKSFPDEPKAVDAWRLIFHPISL